MKKILIIGATHGDEKIGIEVARKINPRFSGLFDFLIANPRALQKKKRFLDFDLNRAYPGKKYSKFYEKRRAYEIFNKAKKYNYVIDIHEASCGTENFIIIPRYKISNKFPLDLIKLRKLLLWPNPKGTLGQFLPKLIELEFGVKNKKRKGVIKKAKNILEFFLKNIELSKKPDSQEKEAYFVYDKISGNKTSNNLKDFKIIQIKNEKFYPLLVNQYLKYGILCYKMKKL